MAVFDEESVFGARPVKPLTHVMGENVDSLSAHELDQRIALLGAEIERLQKAKIEREATRLAAEQAFRR